MNESAGKDLKGKRLHLTLPLGIYEALTVWAQLDRNKPATLAGFLIEREVRNAIAEGKIPQTPEPNSASDLKAFLTQLASGELPTNGQLVTLAHDLGVETEVLMALRDRVRRGNGNKKEGQTNGA